MQTEFCIEIKNEMDKSIRKEGHKEQHQTQLPNGTEIRIERKHAMSKCIRKQGQKENTKR